MVDLSGHVVLSPNRSIEVNKHCFLPPDALHGESPDDSRETYTRNVRDGESSDDSGEESTRNVSLHAT